MRDGSGGEDHYQENNFTCGGGGGEGGGSGKVYNMSQLPLCILLVHGEDLTYSLQLDLMLYPSKFCMKFCIKKNLLVKHVQIIHT